MSTPAAAAATAAADKQVFNTQAEVERDATARGKRRRVVPGRGSVGGVERCLAVGRSREQGDEQAAGGEACERRGARFAVVKAADVVIDTGSFLALSGFLPPVAAGSCRNSPANAVPSEAPTDKLAPRAEATCGRTAAKQPSSLRASRPPRMGLPRGGGAIRITARGDTGAEVVRLAPWGGAIRITARGDTKQAAVATARELVPVGAVLDRRQRTCIQRRAPVLPEDGMVHPGTLASFARMHTHHASAAIPVATSESVVDHMSELPSGAHFGCTVVCEEPLVCDLLAGMISLRGGLHVVKTHDPANAERFFHKEGRDLLILALPLRAGDGADVLQQFVTCSPHGSVVLICHEEPPAELHAWLGAQLRAVIRRVDSLRTLQKALDLIVGQWLPQRRSRLTRHFSGKPLTRREM